MVAEHPTVKNLCAQIPLELHNRVREEQERSGQTLSQYVTWLITEFYNGRKEDVRMGETRTLAVQMPAELFERLDEYLSRNRIKKKDFIIGLIRKALEEAEQGSDEEKQGEEPERNPEQNPEQ